MQGVIALSVERREKEYEKAQGKRAYGPAGIGVGDAAYMVLQPKCAVCKIKRKQACSNAQNDVEGHIGHTEGRKGAGKHGSLSAEDVGDDGSGDGRYEQRQHRLHRHIEEQNLHSEQHTGEGRLEYACHSSGGTAAKKDGYITERQRAQPSYIGADGGACIYYRGLCSH